MKKVDLSAVTTTAGAPQKSGTLIHIQNAYTEAIAAAIIGMIGSGYSTSVAYRLYGCLNSGSGSSWVISAGALFFNGEVYLVPAANFTTSGNTAVGTIQTSYYSATEADPVQFTDGTNKNIHQIRQITFAAALSGSGTTDFSNILNILPNITGGAVSGTYPNITLGNMIVAKGTQSIGNPSNPGQNYTVTIGSTLANSNYMVIATIVCSNTPTNDTIYPVMIHNKTTTTFDIYLAEPAALAQSLSVDWCIIYL
jgi:hypothetical protein